MQITYDQTKNRYYFDCSYEQRNIPRTNGFRWCPIENRWATNDWYKALMAYNNLNLTDNLQLNKYNANTKSSNAEYLDLAEWHDQVDQRLYEFQQAGVEGILSRNNVLLADEQGLGKTAQAIVASRRFGDGEPKTLILCTSSLKMNWYRELNQWLTNFNRFEEMEDEAQILITGMDIIDLDRRIVIVNYDLLESRYLIDQLKEYEADLVILDEAHNLKTAKALRSIAAFSIADKANKVISITGTPVLNRPKELFQVLSRTSPETIAPYNDFHSFAYKFCGAYIDDLGHLNTDGASNLEELNIRLRATCMIRRLKEDVADQLRAKMPPKIVAFAQNEVSKEVSRLEKTLEVETLRKLKKPSKKDLTLNEKMRSIGEDAKYRHELAVAKLPLAIEFIREELNNSNRKLVIFAQHRAVLDGLWEAFDERYNASIIEGGQNMKDRQRNIDDFQNNPNCRVMIGQIQAAGTGLTLTAASDVIFVEWDWTPGVNDQCVDRCHRIGQKNSVTTTFLTVENSIEEHMLRVVYDKRKVINPIMK